MLRFFGGRLEVSPFFAVLLLILTLSPDAPFFFAALLCAALHEAGHIIALKSCGARLERFSLYPCGAELTAQTGTLSYSREALCALAGPLVSLAMTAAAALAFALLPNVYLLSAAVSNFLFFAVNILPVKGLDGGRALLSVLLAHFEYSAAYRIFDIVSSAAFGVLCFAAFALLVVSGYNLSLVFICTYIFISEYVKNMIF